MASSKDIGMFLATKTMGNCDSFLGLILESMFYSFWNVVGFLWPSFWTIVSLFFSSSIFDICWMQFLVFFWVPIFLDFLWFGVRRGSILGGFLDHFSGRSAKTKKCVWTAQACADCISSLPKLHHFWWLFGGCSQEGLWNTIFDDFERFWAPWGRPFGSKKASKNETKKSAQKRARE